MVVCIGLNSILSRISFFLFICLYVYLFVGNAFGNTYVFSKVEEDVLYIKIQSPPVDSTSNESV
jgi:hypothetical protein